MKKPKTVAVTTQQGGEWIPFEDFRDFWNNSKVHSIKFADGSMWDAVNGWREKKDSKK